MKLTWEKKQELLRLHGVTDRKNDDGVKDQSDSYRIRNGIFYRGFDVPTLEEANKEIKRLKSEGLKCFKEFQDKCYYRIFWEQRLDASLEKTEGRMKIDELGNVIIAGVIYSIGFIILDVPFWKELSIGLVFIFGSWVFFIQPIKFAKSQNQVKKEVKNGK